MKNQITYILVAIILLTAVGFLIFSATAKESNFFITVSEIETLSAIERSKPLVISGAVDGSTIVYDEQIPQIEFTIVDIPVDQDVINRQGGLAEILEQAVKNPAAKRLAVIYDGVKPDLLKNNVQVILKGGLESDDLFHADEMLLKCPSRYAEDLPEQAEE